MTIEQHRAKITGRVWQAISESGVNLQAIPRDQVERMVDSITDNMLLTVDDLLNEAAPIQEMASDPTSNTGSEQTLWEGRPFLSIGEHYLVTTERVRVTRGLIARNREDIELFRVKDIDHKQTMGERMMNIGDIFLHTADASEPDVILHNVHNPEQVHEILRRAMLEARQRHGVRLSDDM
jgi:hypothetical protein